MKFIEIATTEIIAASTAALSNRNNNGYKGETAGNRNGWDGLWIK